MTLKQTFPPSPPCKSNYLITLWLLIFLIPILTITKNTYACDSEQIIDQLNWHGISFKVLSADDRYQIETCNKTKCLKQNFDKTVPEDSPDWPVTLNNLMEVGNEIWLGSSEGIYTYKKNKWVPHNLGLANITSLSKMKDHVFATRDGGADVCGVYEWIKEKKKWERIPEGRCMGYVASAVIKDQLYVAAYQSLVVFEFPKWTSRIIKAPDAIESILQLKTDNNKLVMDAKNESGGMVRYTYDALGTKIGSKPLPLTTTDCKSP